MLYLQCSVPALVIDFICNIGAHDDFIYGDVDMI